MAMKPLGRKNALDSLKKDMLAAREETAILAKHKDLVLAKPQAKPVFSYSLKVNTTGIIPMDLTADLVDSRIYKYIMSLIAQKKFSRALKDLKRMVADTQTRQDELYWLLGRLMMAQSRWQEAKAFLETAKELNPDYYNAYASLGELYALVKQPKEAIDELLVCQKMRPADPDIYRLIAEACVQGNALEPASAYYLEALKLNPNHWIAWYGLSNTLHAQGRINDAIETAEKYLGFIRRLPIRTRFEADAHSSFLFLMMAQQRNYKS